MELCVNNLENYIRHRESHQHSVDVAFNELVAKSLLSAVEFLHKSKVVHRDIKPSNIFIKKTHDKSQILLGDFGLARSFVELVLQSDSSIVPFEEESKLTSGLGTYLYAPWEQLDSGDYDFSADIYSTGIVIYELYNNFKTNYERVMSLMDLRKSFQLSLEFQKQWPRIVSFLGSKFNIIPFFNF